MPLVNEQTALEALFSQKLKTFLKCLKDTNKSIITYAQQVQHYSLQDVEVAKLDHQMELSSIVSRLTTNGATRYLFRIPIHLRVPCNLSINRCVANGHIARVNSTTWANYLKLKAVELLNNNNRWRLSWSGNKLRARVRLKLKSITITSSRIDKQDRSSGKRGMKRRRMS